MKGKNKRGDKKGKEGRKKGKGREKKERKKKVPQQGSNPRYSTIQPTAYSYRLR